MTIITNLQGLQLINGMQSSHRDLQNHKSTENRLNLIFFAWLGASTAYTKLGRKIWVGYEHVRSRRDLNNIDMCQ
jgi:hypothetical protein